MISSLKKIIIGVIIVKGLHGQRISGGKMSFSLRPGNVRETCSGQGKIALL